MDYALHLYKDHEIGNEQTESVMIAVIYIEDLFLSKTSFRLCSNDVQIAIKLLEHFVINYKKSSLTPSQRCKYLGMIINSVNYTLELTEKKKTTNCSIM